MEVEGGPGGCGGSEVSKGILSRISIAFEDLSEGGEDTSTCGTRLCISVARFMRKNEKTFLRTIACSDSKEKKLHLNGRRVGYETTKGIREREEAGGVRRSEAGGELERGMVSWVENTQRGVSRGSKGVAPVWKSGGSVGSRICEKIESVFEDGVLFGGDSVYGENNEYGY